MKDDLKVNQIIDNTPQSTVLLGRARVLAIAEIDDELWLIDLPRLKTDEGKENQTQEYLKGPYKVSLHEYREHSDHQRIYALNIPELCSLPDATRRAAATSKKEQDSITRSIGYRDRRHAAIAAMVYDEDSTVLKPTLEVLKEPSLPERVKEQAKAHGLSVRSIYHYLHLFWAGGSQRNALEPGFQRCGNPGQQKPQQRHLGRKPKLFLKGGQPTDGYPLTDDCKKQLEWGFRLIKHGRTEYDAYLLTMSVHWAEHVIDPLTGELKAQLFEPYLRPSFDQFCRWGSRLNGMTVSEILLGPTKRAQRTAARGGSEQDMVTAIGQLAAFDGTSTDTYLTRVNSKLKRLPPMTRMILKETRLGIIYGVYCGWEPPSPSTALQTILHGANPNKSEWAARFGIVMPNDAMPAILARNHLADNGELKAQSATEAEEQFGFGIDIAPVRRGDRKGGIESQHRSDHAQLDHKVPGTTFGKQRERGNALPVTQALWNYYEYMRELIYLIIKHNTEDEVPELAPDDFLLQAPPSRPLA